MPVTEMYPSIPYAQVYISGTEVELVQSFVYLGSKLEANGTCDTEMRRIIAMAREVVNRLCKSVFKRRDVTLDLKLTLFNTCVLLCLW